MAQGLDISYSPAASPGPGRSVRIPIAEPRVGVPGPVGSPRAAAISGSPLSSIGEGVSKLAETAIRIAAVQADHQTALDVQDRVNTFYQGMTEAEVQSLQQPGTKMLGSYKDATTKLVQDTLADPQNAHIAPALTIKLRELQAEGVRSMAVRSITRTADEQEAQLKAMGPQMAQRAAADYSISPAAPLFNDEGPQFYDKAFEHNKAFAVGGSYETKLTPGEEKDFQSWVKDKKIPFDSSAKTSDYDMRGFWKENPDSALRWKQGDHFPDTYKTPYDTTFSGESKYAKPGTPFRWHGDALIDERSGAPIFGGKGGAFASGPAAIQQREQYEQLVQRVYPKDINPEMHNSLMTSFDLTVASERGKIVADNSSSQPAALDQYLKQYGSMLSANQIHELRGRANEAMTAPMRVVEASSKAVQAQTYTNLLHAKSTGKLNDSMVQQAINERKLPQELGEQLVGHRLELPSVPAAVDNIRSAIGLATSPEEINLIVAGVSGNTNVNSTDGATLRVEGENAKIHLKDPLKQANIHYDEAGGLIDQFYSPKTAGDNFNEQTYHIFSQPKAAAHNYYRVHAVGARTQDELDKAYQDAIRFNPVKKTNELVPLTGDAAKRVNAIPAPDAAAVGKAIREGKIVP